MADLELLWSVNGMFAILRMSQRLNEINLLPGSQEATADAGNERTKCLFVPDMRWDSANASQVRETDLFSVDI